MHLPTLYIKPGCPWCDEVIDHLAMENIAVHTIIVSSNPRAMADMIALSGQTKAPTLDWNGIVLADFGVDELIPFLQQHS